MHLLVESVVILQLLNPMAAQKRQEEEESEGEVMVDVEEGKKSEFETLPPLPP